MDGCNPSGVNARRNNRVHAGKGGIFLAIGPKLINFIADNGIVPSGMVAWAHIDHLELGNFGILSLYAPNGSTKRGRFWHELADTLDPQRTWIIGGDFNMVEKATDRRGGS